MTQDKIRSAEQRTQTICLLLLTAIALGAALMHLRPVLVPFVLALFLTMAVTPVMDFLQRRFRFPRGLAIGATIGLAFVGLLLLGGMVSKALSDVVAKKDGYVRQVTHLVSAGEERFFLLQQRFDGLIGGEQETLPAEDSAAPDSSPGLSPQALDDFKAKVPAMVGTAISWTVNSALALLSQGLLVMVFMMFLIAAYRPQEDRDPESLSYQLRARVKEYLRVKILVSAMTGFGTFLILKVLGVDLAMVFGLMAFFLNFIPNIGSAVAILLPLPVIVLAPTVDAGGLNSAGEEVVGGLQLWAKVLAMALPAGLQFLVGNVLEPRWLGKSLDLNPIVILLSLIFWGVLWGPVGMLLSVPITAILKMLLERFELTQPVAALFSDGGGE